jgi:hypothetical protein
MVPQDSAGNNLYSESMQNMDPSYPGYGLSYDNIMPTRDSIQDAQQHPANNLYTPSGGGERPLSSAAKGTASNKVFKQKIDNASRSGRGNKSGHTFGAKARG